MATLAGIADIINRIQRPGGWRDIERGRIGIAVWRFDRMDAASGVYRCRHRRHSSACRYSCLCVNDGEPYKPVYSYRAGRRNRHAVYFSEEGVRSDIIGRAVAGGVGGDTVNASIGVVPEIASA